MKNNIYSFLAILFAGILLTGCGDGLIDLNDDPSKPTNVPAVNLVTGAQHNLFATVHGTGLNAEWGKLMTQQWAQNEYAEESRYEVDGTSFNGTFNTLYASVLSELNNAEGLIGADATLTDARKNNQLAIIAVLKGYAFQILTDGFGAIPFTQALSLEYPNPEYDSQEVVYKGILELYSGAIAKMTDGPSFDAGELVYQGDMAKWKKLANSLMLRAAMRVSNVNEGLAKEYLGKVSGEFITNAAENAVYTFDDNQAVANPLWRNKEVGKRDDYCVSELLVKHLEDTSDPRLPVFVNELATGGYVGMPYGLPDGDAFNLKGLTSRPGDALRSKRTPHVLIGAAQVNFLLAEAYQRGLLSGNAEDAYKAGVTASMEHFGVDGAAYLAANAYDASNWKKSIGEQKWLALYHDGFEAWNEWRRLGYPELSTPAAAKIDVIPVRLPYPLSEQTNNGSSLDKVASDPNDLKTKLWWDVD